MGGLVCRVKDNPWYLACSLGSHGLLNWVPDEVYLKMFYRGAMGKRLDLDNPRTFNEKIQWLKLHDRNPLYITLVDKCDVKPWIAERIGKQYVVQTYGVWDSFDDIDFGELPDRFVLKCTHDSGSVAICHDWGSFDISTTRERLTASLKRNYFWYAREWPYKDVKPRIIAEEYLGPNGGGDLTDYKLFHFNGGPTLTLVCEDRSLAAGMSKTYFDEKWSCVSVSEGGHPTNPGCLRPVYFDDMLNLSNLIAEGIPFCRVDFYESARGLLFGELTFYPAAGLEHFNPPEVDELWGSWIELPTAAGGLSKWLFLAFVSSFTVQTAFRRPFGGGCLVAA